MKKSAVRLGLYITDERDRSFGGDYYHVRASDVVIDLDAHEMRNIDQGIHRSDPVKAIGSATCPTNRFTVSRSTICR